MLVRVLQTLQMSSLGGILARPRVPMMPVFAQILQTFQKSKLGGGCARVVAKFAPMLEKIFHAFRTTVLSADVQYLILTPGALTLVQKLQTLNRIVFHSILARVRAPTLPRLFRHHIATKSHHFGVLSIQRDVRPSLIELRIHTLQRVPHLRFRPRRAAIARHQLAHLSVQFCISLVSEVPRFSRRVVAVLHRAVRVRASARVATACVRVARVVVVRAPRTRSVASRRVAECRLVSSRLSVARAPAKRRSHFPAHRRAPATMDLARARASAYERLRSVGAFRGDDATRRATRDADDAIEWIQKSFRQLETLSDDDDEEEEDDGRAVRRASNASRVARFALVFWYESVRVRKGARARTREG